MSGTYARCQTPVKSGFPLGVRGVGPVGAVFGNGVAKFVVFWACTQVAARAATARVLASIFIVGMMFLVARSASTFYVVRSTFYVTVLPAVSTS
jgi:hypothetical protein